MGMYDMLGTSGDQVKCFPIPVYYYSESNTSARMLGYMGGNLRSYGAGDEVPYQTLWYKYPKDFMVVDSTDSDYDEEYCDAIIHIIRDGKCCKTFDSVQDISEEDILNFALTYDGDVIYNIGTCAELKEYIQIRHDTMIKRREILKHAHEEICDIMSYLRENHFEKPEDDERYQAMVAAYDAADKERDEKLRAVTRELTEHYLYPNDASIEESKLCEAGGYLEVYRKHLEREASDARETQILDCICREFNEYLVQNPSVSLDNYLAWLDDGVATKETVTEYWNNMLLRASAKG